MRYCSLPCYKSHGSRCTESFDRDNVLANMQDCVATPETRRRMLRTLQKFHSDTMNANDHLAAIDHVDDNDKEDSEGDLEDEDHISRRPTSILSEATLNKLAAGSFLNEEIRRKSSEEGGSSAYNARGGNQTPDAGNRTQNRSKSKTKDKDVTCYQCGRKGHKKPDCRYFKKEQERKKEAQEKKKKDERKGEKSATSDSSKDAENANLMEKTCLCQKELHDALPQAEIDNQPVNLEPEEVGHDIDAPNEDREPPELAENDFQQHDRAENELPLDVAPLPENVDHWVGMDIQLGDLSAEEEKAFLRALAAGELSHMIKPWEPWWLSPLASRIVLTKEGTRVAQPLEHSDKDESDHFDVPSPLGSPLPPLRDLTSKLPSPLLGIHLVEVLYSYCFTLRFFNGDWTCDTVAAAWTCLSVSHVLGSSACPETIREALNDCFVTICSPYFKSAGGLKFALALLDDVVALLRVGRPGVICALADLHRMLEKAVKDFKQGVCTPAHKLYPPTGRQKTKASSSSQLKVACKKVFFLLCWANEQPFEVFGTHAFIVENEKGEVSEIQERKNPKVTVNSEKPLIEEVRGDG
ncbi:hypothetical protein L7F22_029431 [Adiantum nelumboides]|nr:hypothetical protein [Adiantum nelumboides]